MKRQWTAAPRWLRVLAILGAVWFAVGVLLGAALLLFPGPGLLVLALAALGVVPGVVLVARATV